MAHFKSAAFFTVILYFLGHIRCIGLHFYCYHLLLVIDKRLQQVLSFSVV